MKPDRAEVIEAVRVVVPEIVAPIFGKDTCILSSAIGQTLLRENGVTAKDHTVRGWALNRQMMAFIDGDLGRLLESWSPEEEDASERAGAWSVGLGYSEDGDAEAAAERGRFAGHVVLTTRNPDGRSRDWSAPAGEIRRAKDRTLGICRNRLRAELRERAAAS